MTSDSGDGVCSNVGSATGDENDGKQASFCVLLHGSLKVESMVAIARIGSVTFIIPFFNTSDNHHILAFHVNAFLCALKLSDIKQLLNICSFTGRLGMECCTRGRIAKRSLISCSQRSNPARTLCLGGAPSRTSAALTSMELVVSVKPNFVRGAKITYFT